MLTTEENELLTKVGPGTPMGALLRQFWTPFLPSRDLLEADGIIKRVRLLGEDLVAFRDSNGEVGLVAENCPHRGASLFFGRNEFCGLACNYHGWKFDITGACIDMPNEPAESNFKDKVRVTAYPVRDVNRMLWTYMGPRETPPPFPQFEVNTLPIDQVQEPHVMTEECNWVQGLEGDLDTSHVYFIHGRIGPDVPAAPGSIRGVWTNDRAPGLDVVTTPYGAVYSGIRRINDKGDIHHRINQYIYPFFTMITIDSTVGLRAWVPIDDDYHMLINMSGKANEKASPQMDVRMMDGFASAGGYIPETSDPRTRYFSYANKGNDYLIDYEVQKNHNMSGVPFLMNLQDRAMTETMGKTYDRRKEHLGTSDRMIIHVRKQLLSASRAFQEDGSLPESVDDPELVRVRPVGIHLKDGEDWVETTKVMRDVDGGLPVEHVPFFD